MYTYSYGNFTLNKQPLDGTTFSWEWPNALEWTEDELYSDVSISASGIYRIDTSTITGGNDCSHDWVNISFNNLHYVCKHCGIDKCE